MGSRPAFRFEAEPGLPGSDRVAKSTLGFLRRFLHRFWDFDVRGLANVPSSGPALICPNHLSFCDSLFVPAALPRRVWAVGKAEYMDDWKTRDLFPAMGMIPIDRSGGDAAQAALDLAAEVLGRGHLFMIYPEGTRSRSGNLHKGRTGAARLAVRCDAPIIPVGVKGTVGIQPPDAVMMKPFKRCTVSFGEPMWARDFGELDDPRLPRAFIDAVMYEISRLSGQTYVNTYAGSADTPAPARPSVPVPPGRPGGNGQTTTPVVPRPSRSVDLRATPAR